MKRLIRAGVILGFGMGGFFDGIVAHQILQMHNMLSNIILPDNLINLEINMFWDGIFHAFTWLCTLLGIFSLITAMQGISPLLNAKKILLGAMLMGWGLFNLIEGIIDHQLLGLHHVWQQTNAINQLFANMAYLASGILFILIGMCIARKKV